jgi:arsenite methyltransferase
MINLDRLGWERLARIGITGHPGGWKATDELARLCNLNSTQSILFVGCGSGQSSVDLAKKWGVKATAFDFALGMARLTRQRSITKSVEDQVYCLQADAHYLPFDSNSFDGVFAESVTLLLNRPKVIAEYLRVLKPGGFVADNEPTWKSSPPESFKAIVRKHLGESTQRVYALEKQEWENLFQEGGFINLQSLLLPYISRTTFFDAFREEGFDTLKIFLKTITTPALLFPSFTLSRWKYRMGVKFLMAGLYFGMKPN